MLHTRAGNVHTCQITSTHIPSKGKTCFALSWGLTNWGITEIFSRPVGMDNRRWTSKVTAASVTGNNVTDHQNKPQTTKPSSSWQLKKGGNGIRKERIGRTNAILCSSRCLESLTFTYINSIYFRECSWKLSVTIAAHNLGCMTSVHNKKLRFANVSCQLWTK